jgi:hypothetical protein
MEGRLLTRTTVIVGVLVTLVVLTLAWMASSQGMAQVPPSNGDCPNASQIEEFTETGDTTTEYFDASTVSFTPPTSSRMALPASSTAWR